MSGTSDWTSFQARQAARVELRAVTAELTANFADLPVSTVIRHIALAREELLRAGVRAGLAAEVASVAEVRLLALLPSSTGR